MIWTSNVIWFHETHPIDQCMGQAGWSAQGEGENIIAVALM